MTTLLPIVTPGDLDLLDFADIELAEPAKPVVGDRRLYLAVYLEIYGVLPDWAHEAPNDTLADPLYTREG